MLSWLLKRLTDEGSKLPGALVSSGTSSPLDICSNCREVARLDIMAPSARRPLSHPKRRACRFVRPQISPRSGSIICD